MIGKLSKDDAQTLSAQVAAELTEVALPAAKATSSLAAAILAGGLKDFSLNRVGDVQRVGVGLTLAGLAHGYELSSRAAQVLVRIPFQGNHTTYETVPTFVAFTGRQAAKRKLDSRPWELLMGSADHDGRPGPVVIGDPMRNRLRGELLRRPLQHPEEVRGDTPMTDAERHVLEILELSVMWMLGGSRAWRRRKIDKEFDANVAHLRATGALPAAG